MKTLSISNFHQELLARKGVKKIYNKSQEIASRVEKELGIPAEKIIKGCLMPREGNWIGKVGVEIALSIGRQGFGAQSFWAEVNRQKDGIIWT